MQLTFLSRVDFMTCSLTEYFENTRNILGMRWEQLHETILNCKKGKGNSPHVGYL
jgi:hypothetical protein